MHVWLIIILAPLNTHKPKINPLSRKIAEHKSSEKKQKNVWEYLYNLDKELKEKRDITYLENKASEEKKNLKECTFQPGLNALDSITMEGTYNQEGNIYKRSIQWKQNVEEK